MGLKVLLYADFRSPHARGWAEGLRDSAVQVILVSSEVVSEFPAAESPRDLVSVIRQRYVEKSSASRLMSATRGPELRGAARRILRRFNRSQLTHSLVHLVRARYLRRRLEGLVDRYKPDFIHALRLPYEGVTALSVRRDLPVVVSTWGSDFSPQAESDFILRRWVVNLMPRVDGYHFDSMQDLPLAKVYGLREEIPTLHAAGNFGVDTGRFFAPSAKVGKLVVYPRRAMPNSNFVGFVEAAIKLSRITSARFVAVGLKPVEAELRSRFRHDLERVELTGQLDGLEMAELFRNASVVVSPTFWDGTPMTVLEALASGAHVVAGDLPELRRLMGAELPLTLIDASSTEEIVNAVIDALAAPNPTHTTLPPQFDRVVNRDRVREFYTDVLTNSGSA